MRRMKGKEVIAHSESQGVDFAEARGSRGDEARKLVH